MEPRTFRSGVTRAKAPGSSGLGLHPSISQRALSLAAPYMRAEHLVTMANDIGAFFDAKANKSEAAQDIANHLTRFWDPRMRREIVAHYRQGGGGLHPTVHSGVALLAEKERPATSQNADP